MIEIDRIYNRTGEERDSSTRQKMNNRTMP